MARPGLPEPADRDRLFVSRIIDERASTLFGDNLQNFIDMPTDERWERMLQAAEDADKDETNRPARYRAYREIFVDVLSDVEAWIVVERARNASRTALRKRRGMSRGQ